MTRRDRFPLTPICATLAFAALVLAVAFAALVLAVWWGAR